MSSPFAAVGRSYVELEYSVIPILPHSKRPGRYVNGVWEGLANWETYAERLPTEKELEAWEKWPDAGVGLLTGEISGVVACDFDLREDIHRELEQVLPPSPVRKVGAKGYTAFYRYFGEENSKWAVGKETVLDILSTGRQTLIPPTLHPDKMEYRWLTPETLLTVTREDLPVLPSISVIREVFARFDPKYLEQQPQITKHRLVSTDGRLFANDLERAVGALDFISPDPYHEWVEMGMALHSAFPSEEGFAVWLNWSKKSSKFVSGECEDKWRSFQKYQGKRLTPATLFKRAMDGGWRDAHRRAKEFYGEPTPAFIDKKKTTTSDSKFTIPEELVRRAPGLVGLITQWILETSIRKQPAIALGAALSFVGALKGRRVRSETDLRTNLLICGLAPSGSGKQQPIKCLYQLASAIRQTELVCGKPTSDSGLLGLLKRNFGVRLILWDEFGESLKSIAGEKASSYSRAIIETTNTIFSHANCMFTGKEYGNTDGKMPSIQLNQPHLCILAVTAHEPLFQTLKAAESANGFVPRFLIMESEDSFAPRQVSMRRISDIPTEILDGCLQILNLPFNPGMDGGAVMSGGNMDQTDEVKLVPFSREAKELFDERSEKYENWWKAAEEHGESLVAICDDDQIALSDMEFAVSLVEKCLTAASNVIIQNLFSSKYEESLKFCLKLFKRAGSKGITRSSFSQKAWRYPKRERDAIVDDLIETGQLFETTLESDQGRSPIIYVHKDFFE